MRDCEREYICVIGSLNYDIIMKQKRMPLQGETYTADSITYSGGGKGANQAVQCAKLGIDTIMVGKGGRDTFGDSLGEKLKDYGVDCSCIGRSSSPTGVGVVHALEDGTLYMLPSLQVPILILHPVKSTDWMSLSGTAGLLFSNWRYQQKWWNISSGRPNSIMYTPYLTLHRPRKWTWRCLRWQTA